MSAISADLSPGMLRRLSHITDSHGNSLSRFHRLQLLPCLEAAQGDLMLSRIDTRALVIGQSANISSISISPGSSYMNERGHVNT